MAKLGLASFVGLGQESTFGTAVARDLFFYHNNESLRVVEERVESPALYRVARHTGRRAQGRVRCEGDITFNPSPRYKAWTRLLHHLLGSSSSAQPDVTTAPTVYQHTITPADALPTGLSIEVGKDGIGHLFSGCKITTMRLRGSAGELLEATASFIGRQLTSIDDSAPTLTEGDLHVAVDTTVSWGGTSQATCSEYDISVENGLAQRFFVDSRFTSEPLRNAHRRVSGSFRIEFNDATLWSDFRNATNRQLIITISGANIAGSYDYETKITLPVTEITDFNPNADTEGPLQGTASFESFVNASNSSEITVLVTNENSSVN